MIDRNNNNNNDNNNNDDNNEYLYIDDIIPIFLKFSTTPIGEPKSEYEKKIINVKKEFYISGNKKKELAEWYLELIENETDKYLIEQDKFNFSVIPVMYLDTPPSSMTEIDRNLIIVRKHMDNLSFSNNQNSQSNSTSSSPSSLQQQQPKQHTTPIYNNLIISLINQVYKLIDIFIKESLCILYYDLSKLTDKFKIDIFINNPLVLPTSTTTNNNNESTKLYDTMVLIDTFNFKEFQQNCRSILKRLERKQQQQVEPSLNTSPYLELLRDTNYLNTMKQYDREFFTMDHSILNSDNPIVGVTGLVLNRLHRLENELKTIQQHWNSTSINSFNQHYGGGRR